MNPVLDHPLQFFIALGLLLPVLAWRTSARRARREQGLDLPGWRKWLQGTLVGLAALLLLVVSVEATRFVGINFCLDLWPGQTWCNHAEGDQPSSD